MKKDMKIESIKINKLKPATYNPRQISTKQYNDLKKSIEKFGLVDPIIINKNGNVVIGGHQRLKICKELKHTEIDCVVLDLSKEDERELNIRLNKNTGDWDFDLLSNFDIDELVDWGFKHIELDINIDKLDDDTNDSVTITVKEDDLVKAKELYNDLKNKGYNVKIK
jgi:ParB-like chromosome segregation protein Spo0J